MPGTSTYTEDTLLLGLQQHDEHAYSYLYDHYSNALFGIILQVVTQQEVAEDVLQETFIKAWQNIRSYNPQKGRLYTWLLNIARNSAIDRVRSKDFNNSAKTVGLSENVYNNADHAMNRVDDVGLKKIISSLPEESRKLLNLAYIQGYTQDEIAKILQIPLGTVKTRIRSTLIQVRKLLGTKV